MWRTFGLPGAVFGGRLKFNVLAVEYGWLGHTPPISLLCRAIQSLVGHAVPILSDSIMVATHEN